MFTKITTVALLAAAAAAATNREFVQYESQFGKSYRTVAEQTAAYRNYQATDSIIRSVNAAAESDPNPDAARVAHNFLSDLSDEQRQNYMGRSSDGAGRAPPQESGHHNGGRQPRNNGRQQRNGGRSNGRHLQATSPVDHSVDGFMHPVKDQGGCGSCYTFGSNTAMEGQIMKLKGENNTDGHFRLSEQEGLACTDAYNNGGC